MAVSKRLRFEVMRRDGFACRYCGTKAGEAELHIDHVVPESLGGVDEPGNLVTACADCNQGKAAISPDQALVEAVADDDLRWGKALEDAAAIRRRDRAKRTRYINAFDKKWSNWHEAGRPDAMVPRPSDWRQSIENFYNAGLPKAELLNLVDVAMNRPGVHNNKTFRYFCGCCWNAIKELQKAARDLIEHDQVEGG